MIERIYNENSNTFSATRESLLWLIVHCFVEHDSGSYYRKIVNFKWGERDDGHYIQSRWKL